MARALHQPDRDDLVERNTRLEARIEVLERRARPRDADDMRVLVAMADCGVGERPFSAAAVVRHAPAAPDLAEALEAADCESPKSLGRLFARVEGLDLHGLRLDRVGEDRYGVVWILRICTPQDSR